MPSQAAAATTSPMTQSDITEEKTTFLDLPPELRLLVYGFFFDAVACPEKPADAKNPSLLCAHPLIRKEALPIWCERLFKFWCEIAEQLRAFNEAMRQFSQDVIFERVDVDQERLGRLRDCWEQLWAEEVKAKREIKFGLSKGDAEHQLRRHRWRLLHEGYCTKASNIRRSFG